jgi:hypothetical protein
MHEGTRNGPPTHPQIDVRRPDAYDRLVGSAAKMGRSERVMAPWVPVLGQQHVSEMSGGLVNDGDDLVSARNRYVENPYRALIP